MIDLYLSASVLAFVVVAMFVVMKVESDADRIRAKAYLKLDKEIALLKLPKGDG